MNPNVNDLLKQLDNINQQALIDIYIPTLKRTVKFKNLTLKQQKNLLKSAIDESLTKLSFNSNIYSIIKENNTESIDINALTTIDRSVISLTLRAVGIDKTYHTDEKEINLDEVIANAPNIELTNLEHTFTSDNITIELTAPQLKTDFELSNYSLNKLKQQNVDLKSVIGELFIYELLKFVKLVTIKGGEDNTEVIFNTIRIEDRIAIAEKFSSNITNIILDFIKAYRILENKFCKIGDTTIDIDGSFFTI
jgi:hypothetical protein